MSEKGQGTEEKAQGGGAGQTQAKPPPPAAAAPGSTPGSTSGQGTTGQGTTGQAAGRTSITNAPIPGAPATQSATPGTTELGAPPAPGATQSKGFGFGQGFTATTPHGETLTRNAAGDYIYKTKSGKEYTYDRKLKFWFDTDGKPPRDQTVVPPREVIDKPRSELLTLGEQELKRARQAQDEGRSGAADRARAKSEWYSGIARGIREGGAPGQGGSGPTA